MPPSSPGSVPRRRNDAGQRRVGAAAVGPVLCAPRRPRRWRAWNSVRRADHRREHVRSDRIAGPWFSNWRAAEPGGAWLRGQPDRSGVMPWRGRGGSAAVQLANAKPPPAPAAAEPVRPSGTACTSWRRCGRASRNVAPLASSPPLSVPPAWPTPFRRDGPDRCRFGS